MKGVRLMKATFKLLKERVQSFAQVRGFDLLLPSKRLILSWFCRAERSRNILNYRNHLESLLMFPD